MAEGPGREPDEPPPPLGSWSRLYAVVCVLAIAVMALLWLFTRWFHIRLGPL